MEDNGKKQRVCIKCGDVLPAGAHGPMNLPPYSCNKPECKEERDRITRRIRGVA